MAKKSKRIVLSQHAKDQMRARNISWDDIVIALKKREITHPYPGGGTRIYSKAGSKPIKVGIRDLEHEILVITVMNWEKD